MAASTSRKLAGSRPSSCLRAGSPAAVAGFKVLQARVHRIAAAGRLRVSERLAADMVHAAGCGAVMTLLAAPKALRPPGLSDAMFDAIVAAIATAEPALRAAGPVPVANTLSAEIPALTMLSDGERHVLAEWLDRIVTATGSGSGS